MKIKFKLRKGSRFKSQFRQMWELGLNWYWDEKNKKWVKCDSDEFRNNIDWMSSDAPCKSIRAFRRKLKSAPKNLTFILDSRFVGCDVSGVGTGGECEKL